MFSRLTEGASMGVFIRMFACTLFRATHVPAEAVWFLSCDGDDAVVAEC